MDTVSLQFQGVCMKSLSMKLHKGHVHMLLNYCQKHNLDLYLVLDSVSNVKSILPKDVKFNYFNEIFLYCNKDPDLYVSINNQLVDENNVNSCLKREIKRNIFNERDDECILEKSIINDGNIYYDLKVSDHRQFSLQDLSLTICRSFIDKSPLCRNIHYLGQELPHRQVDICSDSLLDISIQHQGSICSFLKPLNNDGTKSFSDSREFISDILQLIN